MNIFYDKVNPEDAEQIEQLTRLAYEVREGRKSLLKLYQVEDEAALLAAIRGGQVAEHPAYDHYLGLQTLNQLRDGLRAELAELLKKVNV